MALLKDGGAESSSAFFLTLLRITVIWESRCFFYNFCVSSRRGEGMTCEWINLIPADWKLMSHNWICLISEWRTTEYILLPSLMEFRRDHPKNSYNWMCRAVGCAVQLDVPYSWMCRTTGCAVQLDVPYNLMSKRGFTVYLPAVSHPACCTYTRDNQLYCNVNVLLAICQELTTSEQN
jgi:hypothetical protein